MRLLVLVAFLFVSTAEAGKLKAIYKNNEAPAAYRYVGLFGNSIGDDDYLVTFGEGLKYRSFHVGYLFSTRPGATSIGRDEQLKIQTLGVERDISLQVIISDLSNHRIFDGIYKVHNSDQSRQYARNIDKLVEAEFDKYRTMSSPATPAELRKIFRQLTQDMSTDGDDLQNFEFPTFELQIEYYLTQSAPSSELASAEVSKNGSDALSRKFLRSGSKWYKNHLDASNALTSKLDNHLDISNMTFASFSKRIQYQGLSPRLKRAIQKHLKVEVLTEEGFECEDSVYTWTSAVWVLTDGSTVSYSPGTECD